MRNKYIFILSLTIVCSLLLSLASEGLRSLKEKNVEIDKKKNILNAIGLNTTSLFNSDIDKYFFNNIDTLIIDPNGNFLWDEEGEVVVDVDGRQEDPLLVSDDNGGAYVIWVDYRNEPENGDIYAQHINSDGLISWDIQGVPLTTVSGKQVAPNMSKDGIGGAFVIWNDKSVSTLGHTYGTHLTTNSNDIIAQGIGVPLISSDSQHSGVSIEVAQAGSAIMVWADDKNLDDSTNKDIAKTTINEAN